MNAARRAPSRAAERATRALAPDDMADNWAIQLGADLHRSESREFQRPAGTTSTPPRSTWPAIAAFEKLDEIDPGTRRSARVEKAEAAGSTRAGRTSRRQCRRDLPQRHRPRQGAGQPGPPRAPGAGRWRSRALRRAQGRLTPLQIEALQRDRRRHRPRAPAISVTRSSSRAVERRATEVPRGRRGPLPSSCWPRCHGELPNAPTSPTRASSPASGRDARRDRPPADRRHRRRSGSTIPSSGSSWCASSMRRAPAPPTPARPTPSSRTMDEPDSATTTRPDAPRPVWRCVDEPARGRGALEILRGSRGSARRRATETELTARPSPSCDLGNISAADG